MTNSTMRTVFLLLLGVIFASCSKAGPCKTKDTCENDSKCKCWCSQICDYRNKTAADSPVYIENDPNGKSCYCKQWDLDHFEDNCIMKKNIKEPQ